MFFTREDILKIHNALLQLGVKDSELPNAEPVTYNDTLSIVQEGKNKQIGIKDFFNQISLWKKEDFINITDEYDKYNISLLEAINLVPTLQRKNGLVITFQDVEGNWKIYQFRGNITEFFEKDKWFDLYDYRNNIIQSIVPDEEDLTASIPDENGNSLVSLKDRVYDPTSFSGKGYKILRKNIQSVNIASTKITITEVPSSDGTLSFTINGKETQVAVSATTDNTTALVAQKVAIALQDSMTEYDVSIDASLITLTRKSSGLVTPSVFSASTTGVVCTVTDSNKREFRNILISNSINQPNVIYEIRYDFDLNGETISLPENSTLKFVGGSISNGTLIGNNTKIIADKNEQIFKFDRSNYYIGGTWRIDKWYCAWFGTVADGKAYKAKYNNLGELEKTSELNYFEVLIEGTDNFEPIQEALDAAYNTNIKVVELGLGSYRIAKPLNIGWNNYHSIYFKGIKSGHYGGITEANNESTFILCDTGTYGICINSGCEARISDFDILGWNGINYRKNFTAWQNTTYYVENPEDWNSERVNKLPNHGLEPMSPYAGIVTDAFIRYSEATNPYELPIPPINIKTFNPQNSTGFTVERVTSSGFCVGFGLEVGAFQDNADFYKFYNCDFNNNVYGFSTGSNQARNTALHECSLAQCYIAITNTKVGKQNGGLYGYISNCWFDMCYKILEWKPDTTPIVFYNCYCENSYMIGGSSELSYVLYNIKFVDCNFRLISSLSNPLGLPSCYFYGTALFVRTTISLSNDGILVPLFMVAGGLDNCGIIGKSSSNFRLQKECLFNPYINKFFKVSQIPYMSTLSNRINAYTNTIGTSSSSIIQVSDISAPKELTHTSYSYNEEERILTLETNWIKKSISHEKTICVGDIIFQRYTHVIFVIIKITPSEDNNNATLLCTPIQGFRKIDNKYPLKSEISNTKRWTIYSTRFKAFDNPLIVKSVNGKEITLTNWDDNLKAGVLLSKKHDYEHSFKYEVGLIESVDKSQKKIILKYSNNIDDTFKVINGYMLAEEDAKFWEGTWVQNFIDAQKA